MADRVNKYHVYSAMGYVCSSVWFAAAAILDRPVLWPGIVALMWLVYGCVFGWIASSKEGNQ